MPAIEDARQLIESRLADLDAEAKSLERALASLGKGVGGKRRPGRPRKRASVDVAPPQRKRAHRKRKRKSAKRAARGQRREQLLAAVKANPGARPAELARVIGIKPAQAHKLIAKALKEKLLVKKGMGYILKS